MWLQTKLNINTFINVKTKELYKLSETAFSVGHFYWKW